MGRSLSAPSITPSRMTSNGFARRKIITTAGAYSFALPSDVTECDIAIFGAGGGGALILNFNQTNVAIPGGAGGGGFSRKRFRGLSGGTIAGAVGAQGLAGNLPNASTTNGTSPGSNGGTTTATLAGSTLTATGGTGAVFDTNGTVSRAPGGVGTGGDINANGGRGGRGAGWYQGGFQSSANNAGPGGGGSSGSHVGNGGDGGDATPGANGSTVYCSDGGGGGWGGKGANAFQSANSGLLMSFGGTSKGAGAFITGGNYFSIWGAPHDAEFENVAVQTSSNLPPYIAPRLKDWWDIEDGGRASPAGNLFLNLGQGSVPYPGGLGSGATSFRSYEPGPAGFGGGACGMGRFSPGSSSLDYGEKNLAGVGGGGGSVISGWITDPATSNTALAGTLRGIPGGPGCVIIWY